MPRSETAGPATEMDTRAAAGHASNPRPTGSQRPPASNRDLARRWFREVWNERRDETIDEMMTARSGGRIAGAGEVDREQFKVFRAAMLGAMSDLHVEVEAVAADGDQVVVRWCLTGTHDGNGLGFPPTFRSVEFPGMTWFVFRDGMIEKGWDAWNQGEFIEGLRARE